MVPQAFVGVDKFAVNRNGKLDTAALPKADLSSIGGDGEDDDDEKNKGGESEVEGSVRLMVEAVCGVTGVRRGTELLSIGLDSLRAMQLSARIAKDLRASVTVAQILDCVTVGDVARLVATSVQGERAAGMAVQGGGGAGRRRTRTLRRRRCRRRCGCTRGC